jgi:hypothetical protein
LPLVSELKKSGLMQIREIKDSLEKLIQMIDAQDMDDRPLR